MSWNSQTSDESCVATMMDIMVCDLRDTRDEGLSLARIYSNLLTKKLNELTQNAAIREKLLVTSRNSEYHRPAHVNAVLGTQENLEENITYYCPWKPLSERDSTEDKVP